MHYDYIGSFPIPEQVLPPKLRSLLEPIGLSPSQFVEVASRLEIDHHGPNAEYLHLLMAVVPGQGDDPIKILDEAGNGVVEFSVPSADGYACATEFSPSISGYDYIVAAWGDSSFYTFNLAEKVWMTLGLTPRSVGNDQQRLVYDDLGLPEFGVAEGEVSSSYRWTLKRNVSWKMSNEYLRRYLWMRGARGIRVFYYSAQLQDTPEIRSIMQGQFHILLKPTEGVGWYQLDIREHKQGLLLQLWASVEAVKPELCPEQTANGLIWPGDNNPMTHKRANSLIEYQPVYLDDRFLEKYEQNTFYDSTPVLLYGQWDCSPSYLGQWSFTECRRVGRNLICVPMRELYKPKPDREILHAWSFVVDSADIAHIDLKEEHIVAKVQRLLDVLLRLGDSLLSLGKIIGQHWIAKDITGFDRHKVKDNGWLHYPQLGKLAQVIPLNMTQQAFLSRCKSLHEIWQRIPNGYLKLLLESAGCPRKEINNFGSMKLLQALLNIVEKLNLHKEASDSFISSEEPEGWKDRNDAMAPLFLNNDLRIADAHETVGDCLVTLEQIGFDTANINAGYGKTFDFIINGVIESLGKITYEIDRLLSNK